MNAVARAVTCERVRAQVSLDLDCDLSHLEKRMVDAHLARCAACREFEEGVTEVTRQLRSAPLEVPSTPVIVRLPRRVSLQRLQIGVAAVLILVTFAASSQLQRVSITERLGGASANGRFTEQLPTGVELEHEMAILKLVSERSASYSNARLL